MTDFPDLLDTPASPHVNADRILLRTTSHANQQPTPRTHFISSHGLQPTRNHPRRPMASQTRPRHNVGQQRNNVMLNYCKSHCLSKKVLYIGSTSIKSPDTSVHVRGFQQSQGEWITSSLNLYIPPIPYRTTSHKGLCARSTQARIHRTIYCILPASSGFFFVGKKDRGLRPCINYRGLNAITIKYPYPLPLVPAALEQL